MGVAGVVGPVAGKVVPNAIEEVGKPTTEAGTTLLPATTALPTLPTPPTTVDPHAPYVDKEHSKNVSALLGKTAYLNCRVKNLGNKTVSRTQFKFTAHAQPIRGLNLVVVAKDDSTPRTTLTSEEDWHTVTYCTTPCTRPPQPQKISTSLIFSQLFLIF